MSTFRTVEIVGCTLDDSYAEPTSPMAGAQPKNDPNSIIDPSRDITKAPISRRMYITLVALVSISICLSLAALLCFLVKDPASEASVDSLSGSVGRMMQRLNRMEENVSIICWNYRKTHSRPSQPHHPAKSHHQRLRAHQHLELLRP